MKPVVARIAAGIALALLLCSLSFFHAAQARDIAAQIVDAASGAAIGAAIVTDRSHAVVADREGRVRLTTESETVGVRAAGYQRQTVATAELGGAVAQIRLIPFRPRALYLSFYGVGDKTIRDAALKLIHDSELNAVVIDVKGDRGMVAYRSAVPLATEVGAQRTITIPDLAALLRSLHAQDIYAIARIVVLKDDPLASAHPELALKRKDGSAFRDREGLRWLDPTRRAVWDYDIAIAAEAAAAGFDEIQFDYLRFPDSQDVVLPQPNTVATRVAAITGFLDAAREKLTPYNVFLAADVFGYICWNLDDTHIGQRLEDIMPRVDYLSPMLYPSGFQFGIPGFRNPVANVYEIVHRSLDRIRSRIEVSPQRIRPWLQAFKDYAFDRRQFDADEIRQQIRAADDFGSDGWMLWNPRNVYSGEGLESEISCR